MKRQSKKRQSKKSEFDLNNLPLLPEIIKEIRSFIPKIWNINGKYNLKIGEPVRIEEIDYGKLKSDNIYSVPPTRDCVGKILFIFAEFYEIQFLRKILGIYSRRTYVLHRNYIRPANFSNKKRIIVNKKNIVYEL